MPGDLLSLLPLLNIKAGISMTTMTATVHGGKIKNMQDSSHTKKGARHWAFTEHAFGSGTWIRG